MLGCGGIMNYNNQALSQEMAISTSGSPAEVSAGGLRLNMIPKDGGNTFSGSFYGGMTDGSWQANNFNEDLAARGQEPGQGISNIHDFNPAVGGPIIQDRLWYFGSFRNISVDQFSSGAVTPTFTSEATNEDIEDYYRTFNL